MQRAWLASLRRRGLRELTVKGAEGALTYYRRFAVREGLPVLERASRADISAWVDDQIARGLKASTISTRMMHVRACLNWLVEEGDIEANAALRVEIPKGETKEADLVAPDQMAKALKDLKKARRWREIAIVTLFYDTGMRVGEVAAANREDIDPVAGTLRLHASTTKGRRPRLVALSPGCVGHIERYLRHRDDDDPALFTGKRGRMSRSGIYQILRATFEFTGMMVGPHDLRHSSASEVSALLSTQEMMTLFGWTDEKMPRHYTQQVQAANAIAAHRRASPLDRLPK